MRELLADLLADLLGEEAWVVGGAVRDALLDRPVVDLDIVCAAPEAAARQLARRSGGAPFPLSPEHGSWRVALEGGRTVDFTPQHGSIEEDLGRRDFTINAMAEPISGGAVVDPHGGLADLEQRVLRGVSQHVFDDDPLRLLRAVRHEEELDFALEAETERLVRARAALVTRAAGERVLAELDRLTAGGYRRLAELGLLAPLGGSVDERLDRVDSPSFRLVAVFGEGVRRLRAPNDVRRYARVLLRAEAPPDGSSRAIHRFRRATEPWSLDAIAYLDGGEDVVRAVEEARATQPAEPLLRGDELGLPPGPAIGRILERIEEERAAGTISTREEALELARREAE
jgi:tRNA nucleotidyltransferase/poly(A) polymerase